MFPDLDVDNKLRMARILQQLPSISPDQIQDQTPAPNAPVAPPTATQSPNYTPTMMPSQPGDYTPVPDNMKLPPQPQSPYQAQMDEITRDVSKLGQAGQELTTLKGQPPKPGPVNKLRAALLMPLQILAGAGGVDTTKEYRSLTHPGYAKAMSDYQAKIDAAQEKYTTMKDLIKDRIDALKEEGIISKDEAETVNQKAETALKTQQLQQAIKDSDIRRQEIPPLNQGIQLARDEAAKAGKEFTGEMYNKVIEKYYAAQEAARIAAEEARLKAARVEAEASKKVQRQETNIAQDITKEQTRLNDVIKPLQNARQAITNLKSLRANNDDDGFARLMSVIMTDNALANASHGSVRQNIGIIQELMKSPGWLEYMKGKVQGILHPGKGSISDATMKQIDKILNTMDSQIQAEQDAATKNLSDLNMLDPTEPDTRGKLDEIIKRQYDIPKPAVTSDVPKPPDVKSDDATRAAQIKKIQDQLDAIDAAIKKKTAAQKK